MPAPDTITQIDDALHALRRRVGALESRSGGSSGSSSTMRLSDATPLKNNGTGSAGDDQASARGDHVHPAILWDDIQGKPSISGEDKTYRHVQAIAVDTWIVVHNLEKHPTVAIVDTSGTVIVGDIRYSGLNTLIITFSAVVSGEAYCN
jgi:hypothetical protein